ncbi:MAG: anthranilate phosphoribosyltransferase [Rhodothermaceae bacterium]
MINKYLEKISSGRNLTFDESRLLMNYIITGNTSSSQLAGLLMALKTKGETSEEIAGFISVMRENSIKIPGHQDAVDVCGTGGDNSGTFNISTAAAFVLAGTGVKVAKHGNRSISSKSGSADVLSSLGININLPRHKSEEALKKVGISFLFAPEYHPAMKQVMPVRKELSMKTIFNILGPLTNPANVKRQVIGTYNDHISNLMAGACQYLEMEKVCFVCTENKFDEVLLNGTTRLVEVNETEITERSITNSDFGFPEVNLASIKGETPQYNAELIKSIFEKKEKTPAYYVVAANAALGIYATGVETDLRKCAELAEESIQSGKALDKLNSLKTFGN